MKRELGLPTGPIDPAKYIGRFGTQLDVPKDVETRAREFVAEGGAR